MDELFEQRKKMIAELVHDELYVPMKIKELAIFLNVAKEDSACLTVLFRRENSRLPRRVSI